jgi:glycosyltransferase involved in cell wall biosynthesis
MKKKLGKPLFSIITICYNEEKNIEKTCKSVSEQTHRNFEWIVIDGKSTDGTLDIIKKYKKNISSLISEKDKGIYNAMNKGIKKAKGKYLLFLNGGDYLENKNILQRVADHISKDREEMDIYYGDLLYENGEIVTYKYSKLDKKFFVKGTISHQATFISEKLFSKYGNYEEGYSISSDYDFWIKTIVINHVKTKYIPLIISVFDLSGMSTDYKLAKKQIEERNEILLKYKMINNTEVILGELKWFLLTMLKKAGLYNFIRRAYRKVNKR